MATKNQKNLTVKDAADRFARDPSRIRQICIDNGIGELIEGRIRLLTREDIENIGKIIQNDGRRRTA